jgi:general secretion pathway protein E
MRQDPDIIMIGEIRDLATADMAIQAALTGHLVFSTLHTNDAASAITRLLDLGVAPYLINATVIGVLAQRLVRQLCPACRQPDLALTLPALQAALPSVPVLVQDEPFQPHRPVGCPDCRQSGFRGRRGLFELLTVNEAVRGAVREVPDLDLLRRHSLAEGLQPLRRAGLRQVAEGRTTLDEVLRSTPGWQA